jgi:DNA-binding NtrC family response regulator
MNKILIVDDEESIRTLLSDYLSAEFACSTAANAAEAKILLATGSGSFKVVLTDISMPGASGLELLAHIKEEHPAVVVVMISSDTQAATYAVARGAFDFVSKPFQLSEVRSVIVRALKQSPCQGGSDPTPGKR